MHTYYLVGEPCTAHLAGEHGPVVGGDPVPHVEDRQLHIIYIHTYTYIHVSLYLYITWSAKPVRHISLASTALSSAAIPSHALRIASCL